MRILKKICLFVILLLGILSVVIVLQPNDFRITRSKVMAGPAAPIFDHVNDLHRWDAWSPWAKLDPNAKNSFSGPESGVGASLSWAGNDQVGEGQMTIIESRPPEFIKFRLDFLKPFAGTNTAEFTFIPQGEQTQVSWSMYGQNNFIGKAFSLFMDCDAMVGGEFEKGLTQLDTVVHGQPR